MRESDQTTTEATILVVDDDARTADLYAELFTEYEVLTAYSGEEALVLADETVDVVLLDRSMPMVSGNVVLETIRRRDLDCRVVMVTGTEPDIETLELPFDDYLIKPVSPNRMRDVVARMLDRNACDDAPQEMLMIISRMATLESKMDLDELEISPEYAALETAFRELRAQTVADRSNTSMYAEFTDEKIRSLLS